MSIILSTQKEEWKKETKKEGKEGRKKAGKREREMLFKCMSIYQWFLTLWSSEFSRAIIFSSAPRKSSCWNAGSNVFLGLKKKNAFIFLSLLKDGLPGLTGFFVVAPPPTLSIWRMSLVYVQLDKNSVVTPVSVSVIFPLCHWFVAIWLCSTFIFFVLSLLASKWVAAYIDVF